MENIHLDQLDHSPVNVRTNQADKDDIKSLAASIKAHGLLQPLVVTVHDEGYHVVAGNRRLAALRSLYLKDEPKRTVPCTLIADELAREASLAENVIRRQLTPLEMWEAIANLGDEGDTLSQKEIAARFGQSITFVREAQRLGRVHPDIREAYRKGDIKADAIEAYAATACTDEQISVYQELEQEGRYHQPRTIKNLLGFGGYDTERMLEDVGEAAYKKAGGSIDTDLFGDSKRVSDPILLAKLADDLRRKADKKLAKSLGIKAIDDTEGWWRTWPKERGTEEEEARIAEILETLHEHYSAEEGSDDELTGEQFDALTDERDALLDKRQPVLPEGGEYAVHNGTIYERKPEADESVADELDEDVPFDDVEPEGEGVAPSQKATDELVKMRRERFREVLMNSDGHTLLDQAQDMVCFLYARSLLECDFHAFRFNNKADWMEESDEVKAWDMFRASGDGPTVALHMIASKFTGTAAQTGKPGALAVYASQTGDETWTSTPAFWELFRKKDQLLALLGEFAPRLAVAFENSKTSDIRANAHALCTGGETHGIPTDEEKAAALAWVPSWLRFAPPKDQSH